MFKTYSASAGSGKTFNLVVEYLTICFKNLCGKKSSQMKVTPSSASREAFRKILAITFTNNAAAEMKQRIMDVLKELAFTPAGENLPNFQGYLDIIALRVFGDPLPISANEAHERIQLAAQLQLQSIIYDYDRFAVTTIDSFNQRVIRSSALRLGLNLNYSVEIELKEFYQQAVKEIMDNLRREDKLTDRILTSLNSMAEEKGKVDIEAFLLSTLNLLYGNTEDNYEYLKRLRLLDNSLFEEQIKEWRDFVYKTVPNELKTNIIPKCKSILQHLEDKSGELKDGVNRNVYKAILNWIKDNSYVLDPGKYASFRKNLNLLTEGDFLNKGKSIDQSSLDVITQEALTLSSWAEDTMINYFNTLVLLRNADKLLIIFDIQKKMDEMKEMRALFFISESNILLHEELSKTDGDVSPVVYENLGFNHFLMDEFQDTSLMQWQNMKPLIGNNALSGTGDASLFGDVKQAIYRWRNGDAQILQDLSSFKTQNAHGHGFPNLSEDGFQKVLLDKNFRTLKTVVEFNNDFFEDYAEKTGSHEMYQDVKQIPTHQESGLVEVLFYGNKAELEIPKLSDDFSDLKIFAEKNKDELSQMVFEILYAVQDALNRGYAPGDIMLISRTNNELSLAAQWLIRYGQQVETKKSLCLSQSPEVIAVVETLKLLRNPEDNLAKATIIYSLAQVKNFPNVFSDNVLSLQKADAETFDTFLRNLFGYDISLNKWQGESLLVIVQNIIAAYKLNELKSPFIHDFLDFVMNYLTNRKDDVTDFLDRWEFMKEIDTIPSVQSSARQNAITLMTVHGSKGKESPVIIYPSNNPRQKPLALWVDDLTDTTEDKERQRVAYVEASEALFMASDFVDEYVVGRGREVVDKLNVAYVAHTRAKDVLYLVAEQQKVGSKKGDEIPSYSESLQDFVLNAKKPGGESYFVADEIISNHYFVGDINWKKDGSKPQEEVSEAAHPSMPISDFSIRDLVVSVDIPDDDPRAIGTKVHEYLSQLSSFPQNEAEVQSAVKEAPEPYQPYLERFFNQIISDPELKLFYGPDAKVYNEISILTRDGQEKRPDRVAFLDNKVRVYDYKTGHDNPEYKNQLEEYCQLIREMGYEDVQGRLLFLNL